MAVEAPGKFLVTTALKETWPEKAEILFLGEWCKTYFDNQKNFKNAQTLKYHWDDRKKLKKDYSYLDKLYENLLNELAEDLNNIHKTQFPVNYWRILIGPWLGYFIHIIYDRWYMINTALKGFPKLSTIILEINENKSVPKDFNNFMNLCLSDEWNHFIYGQIINSLNISNVFYKKSNINQTSNEVRYTLREKIKFLYAKFINKYSVNSSYFLINTYLSNFNFLKLLFKLKVIPAPNSSFLIRTSSFSKTLRKFKINSKNRISESNDFEAILRQLIVKQIPICYVESFSELSKMSYRLNWPRSPKTIFTSNSHNSDDVFKEYAARCVDTNNTKLIIGQHGGNYGIGEFNFNEKHEIEICHKYLSWGWKSMDKKILPFGQLKLKNPIKIKNSEKQHLLLVTATFPRYSYFIYSAVLASQWLYYFKDQCEFIDNLNSGIKQETIVRFYKNDYKWNQAKRWKDKFPNIKINNGKKNILVQLKKCRLFVSTYNATTYLESIAMNIPTVIYWDTNYWELRNSAIPFFNKFRKAGIFHDSPSSAAFHINLIWDNVDDWWNSLEVKTALEDFNNNYNKKPKDLIDQLVQIIK